MRSPIILFPSKKRLDARADSVEEQHGLHCHVCAAPDVTRGFTDVVLREAGIFRRDAEQLEHQIDQPEQDDEKNQPRDHYRDDHPNRGDRRPTRHIAALIERGNVYQHDQCDHEQRGQHDGEDDLPRRFPAMASV